MANIVEVARSRGLSVCAELLAKAAFPEDAPADAALAAPLASQPLDALEQLPRRGLDPGLVAVLLPWFEGRPLELGLFAWDVLCRSVLGPEHQALAEQLRGYARAIQPILPAPGANFAGFVQQTSQQAVEAYAAPGYRAASDDGLDDSVLKRALGALDEIRRRHGAEVLLKTTVPETTRQFALFLHLAHLSTLASFYLDYLWNGLGYQAALADLIEVLLDVGARTALPEIDRVMGGKTLAEVELAGYMTARQEMIAGRHKSVYEQIHAATRDEDYRTGALEELLKFPRSHVVYAQCALELGRHPVPFALLNKIAEQSPHWRYAHRARVIAAASLADPADPSVLQLVEQFLGRFGNEFGLWNLTDRYGAKEAVWRTGLRRLLAREAKALPHDWSLWEGAARLLQSTDAVAELDRLVAAQCTG